MSLEVTNISVENKCIDTSHILAKNETKTEDALFSNNFADGSSVSISAKPKENKKSDSKIWHRDFFSNVVKHLLKLNGIQSLICDLFDGEDTDEFAENCFDKIIESLKNPLVRYPLISSIMSQEGFQNCFAELLTTGNSNFDIKNFFRHNPFTANVETGAIIGAACGDASGSYIPYLGRPLFSSLGFCIGGTIGTVVGTVAKSISIVTE